MSKGSGQGVSEKSGGFLPWQKKKAVGPVVPVKPRWYLNTYFWWSGALFILAGGGAIRGVGVITDPGQVREKNLVLVYFAAGVLMFVGGLISQNYQMSVYMAITGDENSSEG